MAKKNKRTWFARLFDMDDNTVSASTVFLVITSITATLLLLIPAVVLLIEVIATHTITTSLSGMAAYIASVTGLYASGGILKGWTNYSSYKFKQTNGKTPELNFIGDDTDNLGDGIGSKIGEKLGELIDNATDYDEEEIDA